MKCEDCKKREYKVTFSYEPMSAVIRGYGSMKICRRCYIKRIEKELVNILNNLEEQKKLLKEEEKK